MIVEETRNIVTRTATSTLIPREAGGYKRFILWASAALRGNNRACAYCYYYYYETDHSPNSEHKSGASSGLHGRYLSFNTLTLGSVCVIKTINVQTDKSVLLFINNSDHVG